MNEWINTWMKFLHWKSRCKMLLGWYEICEWSDIISLDMCHEEEKTKLQNIGTVFMRRLKSYLNFFCCTWNKKPEQHQAVNAFITTRDWRTVIQETEKVDLPAICRNGWNWTLLMAQMKWKSSIADCFPVTKYNGRTNKRSTKYGDHYCLSFLCLGQRVGST